MAVVHARQTLCVAWSAGKTILHKGDVWDAEADLVRERPDLFVGEPLNVRGRKSGRPTVERATRAPGEVRRTPGKPRKPKSTGDGEAQPKATDEAGADD